MCSRQTDRWDNRNASKLFDVREGRFMFNLPSSGKDAGEREESIKETVDYEHGLQLKLCSNVKATT